MQTPEPSQPAPETLKTIVSATPGVALASMIAWRSDPAPVSAVLVTVKVAAVAIEPDRPEEQEPRGGASGFLFLLQIRTS